ncbi:MAG: carboxypeptidase-like regulatory domain-containing protein [Planctomycetaceae bacterium]|nr:carboxypeptidase-like regulatory domain-containing protein [Planctomycetaceae bacterium]
MNKYFTLILLVSLCLCGCGKKRPEGLGPTYPSNITVTKGGVPLPGARIALHSKTGTDFAFAGMTDSTGKAEMKSEFDYKGLPAGTYRVAVIKPPENPIPKKSQKEIDAMSMDEGRAYFAQYNAAAAKLEKIIPDHLTLPSASPLEIVVTEAGPNEFKFEIDDYKTPPKNWRPPNH